MCWARGTWYHADAEMGKGGLLGSEARATARGQPRREQPGVGRRSLIQRFRPDKAERPSRPLRFALSLATLPNEESPAADDRAPESLSLRSDDGCHLRLMPQNAAMREIGITISSRSRANAWGEPSCSHSFTNFGRFPCHSLP